MLGRVCACVPGRGTDIGLTRSPYGAASWKEAVPEGATQWQLLEPVLAGEAWS